MSVSDPYLISLSNEISEYVRNLGPGDRQTMEKITEIVPGYGGFRHYAFFNAIIDIVKPKKVLLIGVYRGRDACFILESARKAGVEISLTGVDKFSDDFCEDWPEEKLKLSWEDAGFGTAPNIEESRNHISSAGYDHFELIQKHDDQFLAACTEVYDLIYIDTSHDYQTVLRQIYQVRTLLHSNTIIAGDDYSDHDTWGVIKAVKENTTEHVVFDNWIWYTSAVHIDPNMRSIRRHFKNLVKK